MPNQQEQSSIFDPKKIQEIAERMIPDGTMPSREKFLAAIERIRAKYAGKILEARKLDESNDG